jgi:hypothetical protein
MAKVNEKVLQSVQIFKIGKWVLISISPLIFEILNTKE